MFIILFIQLIQKKTKNKENILNLILTLKSTVVPATSSEWVSEVTQSGLTLCDPVDCSSPGSSVHGIVQARILEWVAISFSREHYQLHYHHFYACFWTCWAWNNKDTVLLYSIHYCTVKDTNVQPLIEDAHTWQCTPYTWTNLRDWSWEYTLNLWKFSCRRLTVLRTGTNSLNPRMLQTFKWGLNIHRDL